MFAGKPVIGITGGIGSGKSFIAGLFAELQCGVIDSDAQVRAAYGDPAVRETLRKWWGEGVFMPDGAVNRSAIGKKVFADASERVSLESLLHPMVHAARIREMENLRKLPGIVAFVWDTPLLFETGLNRECDAIVFINSPFHLRLERVAMGRGWGEAELRRREILQWGLDRKRKISDYVIENTADVGEARRQVRAVFSRILERASHCPNPV